MPSLSLSQSSLFGGHALTSFFHPLSSQLIFSELFAVTDSIFKFKVHSEIHIQLQGDDTVRLANTAIT